MIEDDADFVVQNILRQAERRDVGPHQAAGLVLLLEQRDFVAQGPKIVGDGQRSGAGADQARCACRSSAAESWARRCEISPRRSAATRFRRQMATGFSVCFVHSIGKAAAAAGRLTRPVAGPPENRREHVRLPVDHVGFGVLALGDQADVFGNVGVGRDRPIGNRRLCESTPGHEHRWFSQWSASLEVGPRNRRPRIIVAT